MSTVTFGRQTRATTAPDATVRNTAFPRVRSARTMSRIPRLREMTDAEPMPIIWPKAMSRVMIGNATVTPAMARGTDPVTDVDGVHDVVEGHRGHAHDGRHGQSPEEPPHRHVRQHVLAHASLSVIRCTSHKRRSIAPDSCFPNYIGCSCFPWDTCLSAIRRAGGVRAGRPGTRLQQAI